MITNDERFIRIQGILSMSDIHFEDCTKITDLIIDLSHEKNKAQNNWNELKKWLEENESFDDYCNEITFTSVLDKMQELEGNNE